MLKLWTRLMVGLIFVFVTISAPMHAGAMGVAHEQKVTAAAPTASVMPEMAGMSDACAKAMAAEQAHDKAKPAKAPIGHGKGCCLEGCNCPLSHCPATAPLLAPVGFAILHIEDAATGASKTQTLRSYLADTLKRPPRA